MCAYVTASFRVEITSYMPTADRSVRCGEICYFLMEKFLTSRLEWQKIVRSKVGEAAEVSTFGLDSGRSGTHVPLWSENLPKTTRPVPVARDCGGAAPPRRTNSACGPPRSAGGAGRRVGAKRRGRERGGHVVELLPLLLN